MSACSPPPLTIEDKIVGYFTKGDWRNLLIDGTMLQPNKFLPWIWPSEGNLKFIASMAQQLSASRIVSIGCGFGLLEWLLQQATGMKVKGVEVDKAWWQSKYCGHTFIPLEFSKGFTSGYQATEKTDAIFFCYFNNEPAFLDYMKQYEGPCLIIVGPGDDRGAYRQNLLHYLQQWPMSGNIMENKKWTVVKTLLPFTKEFVNKLPHR